MSKLIWGTAWTCVALWSVVCWLAAFVLDAATGLAAGSGGVLSTLVPGIEPLAHSLAALAQQVGDTVLFLMWAVLSVAILAGAWLIAQVAGEVGRRNPDRRGFRGHGMDGASAHMPFAGPFMDVGPATDFGPVIDQPAPDARPAPPATVGAAARAIARASIRRT